VERLHKCDKYGKITKEDGVKLRAIKQALILSQKETKEEESCPRNIKHLQDKDMI
jgi:hypothetical protein